MNLESCGICIHETLLCRLYSRFDEYLEIQERDEFVSLFIL